MFKIDFVNLQNKYGQISGLFTEAPYTQLFEGTDQKCVNVDEHIYEGAVLNNTPHGLGTQVQHFFDEKNQVKWQRNLTAIYINGQPTIGEYKIKRDGEPGTQVVRVGLTKIISNQGNLIFESNLTMKHNKFVNGDDYRQDFSPYLKNHTATIYTQYIDELVIESVSNGHQLSSKLSIRQHMVSTKIGENFFVEETKRNVIILFGSDKDQKRIVIQKLGDNLHNKNGQITKNRFLWFMFTQTLLVKQYL